MAIRVSDITSADWSPAVGSPGDIVAGLDDIEQCLGIILTTPKGSDPHRPLFGCDAWLWVDKPAPIAIPNIIRESVDSLRIWEPRIAIISVTARQDLITVTYQPVFSAATITTEVPLGAA